jgi:outer membrane protein TolC
LELPTYYTASVITERPDVKYYLYTIQAQEEQLKALKTDFYPNITIDGSIGFESITPNLLFSKSSLFATIAPTLKLPIFDSGRITSNYKLAGLDLNTFIENYNQTVSSSIRDVNDNLYKLKNEELLLKSTLDIYENKKTIFKSMNDRYEIGTISHYEFVQERDELLNEERVSNEQMFNRFNQQIDLINSLGGINITKAKTGV